MTAGGKLRGAPGGGTSGQVGRLPIPRKKVSDKGSLPASDAPDEGLPVLEGRLKGKISDGGNACRDGGSPGASRRGPNHFPFRARELDLPCLPLGSLWPPPP